MIKIVFLDGNDKKKSTKYIQSSLTAVKTLIRPCGEQNGDNSDSSFITITSLFKYNENFTTTTWKFSDKNSDSFHISAQNIDCGYSLEPPRRGGSNEYHYLYFWAEIRKIMYTPVSPSFTI